MTTRSVPLAAVVLGAILLAATGASAQCLTGAREFASIGGGPGTEKLRIHTVWAHASGQEIGRFWDPADSGLTNNLGGSCPSNDPTQAFGEWWSQIGQNPRLRGIRGSISGVNCDANVCGDGELLVLVEDWGLTGPPGIDDSAWFVALRTPFDPPGVGGNRRWDLALTDNPQWGEASPTLMEMAEIPAPRLTSFLASGPDYELVLSIPDPARGVRAIDAQRHPLPASSVITGFSIYRTWVDDQDEEPGRDVLGWGSPIAQVPYVGGDTSVGLFLPQACSPEWDGNTRLSVGIDFDGGSGGDVSGALVGRSIELPCPFIWPSWGGKIPDGHLVSGEPLRLDRTFGPSGPEITFSWGDHCPNEGVTGVLYEGPLGHFKSHVPIKQQCRPATYDWTPAPGNTFYLVAGVGLPGDFETPGEGSYGSGVQRSPSATSCYFFTSSSCPN